MLNDILSVLWNEHQKPFWLSTVPF